MQRFFAALTMTSWGNDKFGVMTSWGYLDNIKEGALFVAYIDASHAHIDFE